jgi:hypothetical protein
LRKKFDEWTDARALGWLFIGVGVAFQFARIFLFKFYDSESNDVQLIGIVLTFCGIVCLVFHLIEKRSPKPTKVDNEKEGQ